jgi:hypothetical protein
MNENKKGGRIRLIEIDQLLKNKFDIHCYFFTTNISHPFSLKVLFPNDVPE